jgi:hypothetical protein
VAKQAVVSAMGEWCSKRMQESATNFTKKRKKVEKVRKICEKRILRANFPPCRTFLRRNQ